MKSKGFTLVEIMLVVVIIGALAAMIVPSLSGRVDKARKTLARADVWNNIPSGLKLYELDNGRFPTSAQGLDALREKPTSSPVPKNWDGPYLEKDPVDPWGNPYKYVCPGKHRKDYDLYSVGIDPETDEDDITNWEE